MSKPKTVLIKTTLHCFLIAFGLVTAILINGLFDYPGPQISPFQTTKANEFYKFLTQYAFLLNSSGIDIEFREGMLESAREQYEIFLHNIHYKKDCSQQDLTAGDAVMCIVNGRQFDYFYLVR